MKATLVALLALAAVASALAPIDSLVQRAIEKNENVDILVHFPVREPKPVSAYAGMTRAERRVAVREALGKHAAAYQEATLSLIKARGFNVRSFWINNSIYVRGATPELVTVLRQQRSVMEISADQEVARVHDPMVHEVFNDNKGINALEWSLEIINIEGAWNVTKGEATTLSNIDTGVRYTHVALVDNYRGNLGGGRYDHDFNWYDPRGVNAYPYDNNGHGTHTMGSIVGAESVGIGVAPGAKWIAAKGCASSSCSNADLIASAEYVLCPTTQDGTVEDCTKGADVMSNSWGGGRGSTTYLPYINAWIEAGSVPVFSQGNSGSACSTANSPGDLGVVIGVGSTNQQDSLSSFSSRGPGIGGNDFPTQKPDISAPGERIYSSYYTSDTAYATLSGTSMACPHVSGLVGLMLSANPRLTYSDVRTILNETADRGLPAPNGGLQTCSGVSYTTYPNYHYGYGRINAARAVNAALLRI